MCINGNENNTDIRIENVVITTAVSQNMMRRILNPVS